MNEKIVPMIRQYILKNLETCTNTPDDDIDRLMWLQVSALRVILGLFVYATTIAVNADDQAHRGLRSRQGVVPLPCNGCQQVAGLHRT